jgi:hypothetical protein
MIKMAKILEAKVIGDDHEQYHLEGIVQGKEKLVVNQ